VSSHRPRKSSLGVLLVPVAAAYFAAARLGLSMAYIAPQVSAVWPPTALALAALLLGSRRLWPGIWAGAFLANLASPTPLPVAFGIACGNTLEALLAASMLRRAGVGTALERVRDVVGLAVAAAVAPIASATVGVGSLVLGRMQPAGAAVPLWLTWWLGDAMSVLLFAPALLVWGARLPQTPRLRRPLEALLLLASLAAVCYFEFSDRFASMAVHYSLAYLVFPFLLAISIRLGQPMATLAIVGTAVVAIRGTAHGFGPFGAGAAHLNLVLLQAFLAVLALTALLVAAAVAERNTETRRRAADYGVTLALAESASLETAAPRIARSICENLDWDVGLLWIMDERLGALRLLELWHRPDVSLPRFTATSRETTMAPGIGLPGRVFATARPAWIPDVLKDTNFPRGSAAAAEGLHGGFGFPIVLQHEVLGVIEFFSRDIRRPDEPLLRMFTTVGAQIGQFMDRRRAEEERVVLLARERSAREEAERALFRLRQAEAELLRSAEAKDQFLALLGHELRNPLAPLRNALEILRDRLQGDLQAAATHRMMERQLAHLVRLVDDLLDVARITRGMIELRRARVDLGALAAQAAEASRPLLDDRGCHLQLSLPAQPLPVDADAMRLEQVIANLLSNAGKYSEPGQRIWLAVAREGEEGVLTVADEGIGIPDEMRERVFDLFVQAGRVSGRVPEGLGMGLTLVRSLVEQHGGRVSVASSGHGSGSTFTVRLPLAPAAESAAARPAAAPAPPRAPGGRRVLVVDDNVDGAESLGLLLSLDGHEVRLAHDGPSALDTARQYQPDVVLLDIGLPDAMDGYEVARRLRSELGLRSALLLALTGFGQEEDRRRSREAGFDDHLVKPVEPARLKRLLSELCGREA
jgi:signal transduction histidine kinase/integral membrane sensor domain MASE1